MLRFLLSPFFRFFCLLALLLPVPAYSAGIPVIDATNLAQTTISAMEAVNQTLKQIEEYALQLRQYEDQIKNTLAPSAYIWSQAQKTMNNVLALQDQLAYYSKVAGNLDGYLEKFGNPGFYRSSPYFAAPSTDPATLEKQRRQAEEWGLEAQKKTNDNVARTLEQQQEALARDASRLEELQSAAQTAQGRLEAIQYTNQLLAQQSNQMLQLRGALMAKMAADNAREQTNAAREARERAAWEKAYESRYEENPKKYW